MATKPKTAPATAAKTAPKSSVNVSTPAKASAATAPKKKQAPKKPAAAVLKRTETTSKSTAVTATPNAVPAKKTAASTPAKDKPKTDSTVVPVPVAKPAAAVAIAASGSGDRKWSEIRALLEKLKEDTLTEIRKTVKKGAEAVAAIEPGGDIYDQASSERDRELGLLLGDREREKIHNIDEALLRIDEGEYGICEECDEEIPLGRLKAMPFARHCVKCKSDLEKLQAQTKRVEEERAYREIPLGAEEEEA